MAFVCTEGNVLILLYSQEHLHFTADLRLSMFCYLPSFGKAKAMSERD